MKRALLTQVALGGLLGVSLAGTASAQAPAPAEEKANREVIIVTAQKREEDVQDVPISISAFNAETLEDAGIKDIRDLKFIAPGLSFATAPQTTNTRVSIRGIGTSGNTAIEPSVAVFIDGVYVPRVGSLLAGLNDIAGVEVLRGPQGTLFGRNASMGAINIRTGEPTKEFGGKASFLYGSYNRVKGEGVVNVPITDNLRTRASIVYDDRDGYGQNELNGQDIAYSRNITARVGAVWDITDTISWDVRGDYQRTTGDGLPIVSVVAESVWAGGVANWTRVLDPDGTSGPQVGQLPFLNKTYTQSVYQESEGYLNDNQYGLASNLTWDIGDWQLKLISGYRDWKNTQYQGSTGNIPLALTPRDGLYISESKSHELQLISPDDLFGDHLNFVAGLYWYEEDFDIGDTRFILPNQCNIFYRNTRPATQTPTQVNNAVNNCLNQPRAPSSYGNFSQNTEATAAFWQGTYKITDQWDFTAGIRYSKDEKSGSFDQRSYNVADAAATENTQLALSQNRTTYRASTSYKPFDDVMFYAAWSTGFKSGGFDSGRGTTVVGQKRVFNPELTENLEAGVKSTLLNDSLVANLSVFKTNVDEYQFRTYDGVSFSVRNNGSIEIKGLEWDITYYPIENLTFNFSGSWLDSKYTDFQGAPGLPAVGGTQDLTGQRVPYTSEFSANGFVRYERELTPNWKFAARADVSNISDAILSSDGSNDPMTREPGHTYYGVRFELEHLASDWVLALAGQNIGNELTCGARFAQPNDSNYGLRNTATGSTIYRCSLGNPRTWSLEATKRF